MENIFSQYRGMGKMKKRQGHNFGFGRQKRHRASCLKVEESLASALLDKEYIIKGIETSNEDMKDFLFTLGCYEGQAITLISILSDQYVIVVKDARYSIDKNLASSIII